VKDSYLMKCDICNFENECDSCYGEFNCKQCGQRYEYDERISIVLTDEQLALLAADYKHKNQTKVVSPLKLFVWQEFEPDYTNGLAVAIAENEQKASELIIEFRGGYYVGTRDWGPVEVYEIGKPMAFCVSGGS
jgi:predicted amidophosphoribosyltransferase